FESPVTSSRSVVAITGVTDANQIQVLDALEDVGQVQNMFGSVVFVRANEVQSMLVGETYTVGALPFWLPVWHTLNQHPLILALLILFGGMLLLYLSWRLVKRMLARSAKV